MEYDSVADVRVTVSDENGDFYDTDDETETVSATYVGSRAGFADQRAFKPAAGSADSTERVEVAVVADRAGTP